MAEKSTWINADREVAKLVHLWKFCCQALHTKDLCQMIFSPYNTINGVVQKYPSLLGKKWYENTVTVSCKWANHVCSDTHFRQITLLTMCSSFVKIYRGWPAWYNKGLESYSWARQHCQIHSGSSERLCLSCLATMIL